jgi:hypothetical protein
MLQPAPTDEEVAAMTFSRDFGDRGHGDGWSRLDTEDLGCMAVHLGFSFAMIDRELRKFCYEVSSPHPISTCFG